MKYFITGENKIESVKTTAHHASRGSDTQLNTFIRKEIRIQCVEFGENVGRGKRWSH